MATGIQGPQGYKGLRGLQGITGWGAIGSNTGPTGPTGVMGTFSLQSTVTTTLTLSASAVSTLYSLTSGTLALSSAGGISQGGFFVLSNQNNVPCVISPTSITINSDPGSYTLPAGGSVTLVFDTGSNFIAI